MQISGVGFSGNLSGPTLTINENVKAQLNKNLRGVPLGQVTAQPVVDVQTANVIQITSAQFELKPGQAEFRESVTVTEFDGTLKSRVIKIRLREEDWELQSIQAQGGVVVKITSSKRRANWLHTIWPQVLCCFEGIRVGRWTNDPVVLTCCWFIRKRK